MNRFWIFLVGLLGVVQLCTLVHAGDDDAYYKKKNGDDDDYIDLGDEDFDQVSVMPVSCVNYMNGNFIKFELFENSNNFQCHAANLGTFIVSISHYMRAYFNYQALLQGPDFKLPTDAGYLNCVLLQQTAYSDQKLYAKIGCLERETYTSTKLKIHVYTDKQCSEEYDDGDNNAKGYSINGYYFNSKVSFRPPFYSCSTCKPKSISSSFSKKGTYWYDDDAAANGKKMYKYFDDWLDDYFKQDDAYFNIQQYTNNARYYEKEDDDDFYTIDDDGRRLVEKDEMEATNNNKVEVLPVQNNNLVGSRKLKAAEGQLEKFEQEFYAEQRELSNSYYNFDDEILNWNMCRKIYKYGVWCDDECRELDTFRIDEWSNSDMFLLAVMCIFMGSMMVLVLAKRVKAYEKASIYGDEFASGLGIPPFAMGLLFVVVFAAVIILANLRLVNETLVFAVVTCILLFIYMLKLTLFESKTPLLGGGRKPRIDYNNYGGGPMYNY